VFNNDFSPLRAGMLADDRHASDNTCATFDGPADHASARTELPTGTSVKKQERDDADYSSARPQLLTAYEHRSTVSIMTIIRAPCRTSWAAFVCGDGRISRLCQRHHLTILWDRHLRARLSDF
jgi:hypothetical protein